MPIRRPAHGRIVAAAAARVTPAALGRRGSGSIPRLIFLRVYVAIANYQSIVATLMEKAKTNAKRAANPTTAVAT
uniref:Uncharacterized protein n=1 Tax=Oryza nivara TaxID=4536 RepID=A0A0E0G2W2_ORYNI